MSQTNHYTNPFEDLAERLSRIEKCLLNIIDIDKKENESFQGSKPLRLEAAASYIGVAHTTLYSLVHQRRIKPLKPGKHLLFTKESLEAYLRGELPEVQEKPDPSTYLLKNKKAAQ